MMMLWLGLGQAEEGREVETDRVWLRIQGIAAIGREPQQLQPLERKDAGWLALLALQGSLPRDQLASWLWPDVPLKTAAGSLRQRIFRLRRRLGHELVAAGQRVELLPDVRVLLPGRADAADSGDGSGTGAATTDPNASAAPLTPPPELLAGHDYADCPLLDQWLTGQRQARRQQWLTALEVWADAAEQRRALDAALAAAQHLTAAEPLAEPAVRRLMRLHYLRGDRAAAILAFEQLEQRLRAELGTRPAPATLELLATVEAAGRDFGRVVSPVVHPQAGPGARLTTARPAMPPPAGGPSPVRTEVPASLLRPPRLIGRAAELAALQQAWAGGRVLLVLGEAGLGKSRLLEALAGTAGPPANSLRVAARPGDAAVPDALMARLLRWLHQRCGAALPAPHRRELARLLPELADGPLPKVDGQRGLLQRAAQALLAAARGQGLQLLLVDDLHFADAASLELLQALLVSEVAGEDDGAPPLLRWCLAQRAGEGEPAAKALADTLLETQRLHPLALQPLDEPAVAELIDSLGLPELDAAALAPALRRHTGGNPLFLLETLRDLVLRGPDGNGLPQPATVGALIDRRLRTLSEPALSLARVAAIAGSDFDIAMAEAVLATPALRLADAWAELQSAQVLAGSAFAHDLVFESVQRSVPAEIARHVHVSIAQYLEPRGAEPATCATHWAAGGRHAQAGTCWSKAAHLSRRLGNMSQGLAQLQQATDAFNMAGLLEQATLAQLEQADLVLDVQGAPAMLAHLDAILARPLQTALFERATACRATALVWNGQLAKAAACAEPLLFPGSASMDPMARCEAAVAWGHAMVHTGRATEVLPLLDQLAPLAIALPIETVQLPVMALRTQALISTGRRREALKVAAETADVARRVGARRELANALASMALVEMPLGLGRQALARAEELHRLNQSELADDTTRWVHDSNYGVFLHAMGEYGRAIDVLEMALTNLNALLPDSAFVSSTECLLADVWITLGQPSRAGRLLDSSRPADPAFVQARRWMLKSRWLRARPAPSARADADKCLGQAMAVLGTGAVDLPMRMSVWLEQAQFLPRDEALAVCDRVQADAQRLDSPLVALLAMQRRLQVILTANGHQLAPDAALQPVADSVQQGVESLEGVGVYPPACWLAVAHARRALGDTERLLEALRAGRAWIIRVVNHHLPPAFVDSFCERNAVNREILRWCDQLGIPRDDSR